MSNVNGKYSKDENGNVYSPITSTDSIYYNGQKLTTFLDDLSKNYINYKVLYTGNARVPSRNSGESTTISLSDNINNYNTIIVKNIQRASIIGKVEGESNILDVERPIAFLDFSNWSNEYTNFFGFYIKKLNNTQLQVYYGMLSKIANDSSVSVHPDYNTNINSIIGLKL